MTTTRRCGRRPRGRPASASRASRGWCRGRPSSRSTRWVVPVGFPSSSTSGASIGTTWPLEAALGPGCRRRVAATRGRTRRSRCAGDAPLVGDALGAFELRRELVLAEVRLGDAGRPSPSSLDEFMPIGIRLIDSTPHGDRDVDDAGRRPARRRGWSPAATIRTGCRPSSPRPRLRQARGQPRGAGDVERLLADLADAAADDLADLARGRSRRASTSSPQTVASRSAGCTVDRPPLRRPIGLRTASMITASGMRGILRPGSAGRLRRRDDDGRLRRPGGRVRPHVRPGARRRGRWPAGWPLRVPHVPPRRPAGRPRGGSSSRWSTTGGTIRMRRGGMAAGSRRTLRNAQCQLLCHVSIVQTGCDTHPRGQVPGSATA